MLRITEDEVHGCFLLQPTGSLRKADLDALGERFEARAAAGASVPNLVIQSASFPTWSNLAALLEHLRFIRGHHREIGKVAIVSDARAFDLAPRIARLFVSARLRHFPADALPAALDWVALRDEAPASVVIMRDLPDDTVGISVSGVVSDDDYANLIVPALAGALARASAPKLILRVGTEFESFPAAALWRDPRLRPLGLDRLGQLALVSDVAWIASAARLFAPLLPAEVAVFGERDLEKAKAWTAIGDAPEPADQNSGKTK